MEPRIFLTATATGLCLSIGTLTFLKIDWLIGGLLILIGLGNAVILIKLLREQHR